MLERLVIEMLGKQLRGFIGYAHGKSRKSQQQNRQKVISLGESCGNAEEVERQESPRVGAGHWQVRSSLLLIMFIER